MIPQPGEIWLADLGLAAKTRPVIIVSRRDPDAPRSLVLYVPLTTQRRDSPYEVRCRGFRSLIVNQSLMFKGWDPCPPCALNAGSAGFPQR
jgi:mRNA-degrading endonuclease toxin of MazEF toxin-antitoxin module